MATRGKISKPDIDSITKTIMAKQQSYLELWLAQIQQVGMEKKLSAIEAKLASLAANVSIVRSKVEELKGSISYFEQAVSVPAPLITNEHRLSTPALPATCPSQGEDATSASDNVR